MTACGGVCDGNPFHGEEIPPPRSGILPVPRWSYETPESVASAIEGHLAPVLLDRDPGDLEGASAAMDAVIAPGSSTGMPIAKAGIDLALHDLAGKELGDRTL